MATAKTNGTRSGARTFGAYVRLLRENFYEQGRGKGLRQLARDAGIAPSVLSRGERGLQDLRQIEYIERLAPQLGVRASVLKRVADFITPEDIMYFQGEGRSLVLSAELGRRGASAVLWSRLLGEMEHLRVSSPETLEAVLAYVEFLRARLLRERPTVARVEATHPEKVAGPTGTL
jgi:transcriptional regulator with XRE-family HTH domain